MRFWLLILAGWANALDIGAISELRGNGEVVRQGSTDKLLAEMALDIFSHDDVRTGNGRIAIQFLDSSVVRLSVKDNGPGIPQEDREKLFMAFFSTKRRGSGLGLAIVRRIVVEHGGAIHVDDNLPNGTIFTVELPC